MTVTSVVYDNFNHLHSKEDCNNCTFHDLKNTFSFDIQTFYKEFLLTRPLHCRVPHKNLWVLPFRK
jgi:hypothetical protein